MIQGVRDWRDILVSADVCCHLGVCAGLAVRVQGMRRYYALILHRSGEVQITKVIGDETVLARHRICTGNWGRLISCNCVYAGTHLIACVDGKEVLAAFDEALSSGGMALVIEEGRTATQRGDSEPA